MLLWRASELLVEEWTDLCKPCNLLDLNGPRKYERVWNGEDAQYAEEGRLRRKERIVGPHDYTSTILLKWN